MFYTLTLNPALDYIVKTDELSLGKTNRSGFEEIQFGGKGINVSYVLSQLGVQNVALGFVAGFTGQELERLTNQMGIKTDFVHLSDGMTRINVKIKDATETEINASGPYVTQNDLNHLFEKLGSLSCGDTLVLSGSVPSGVPSDIYEKIMVRLQPKGVRFVVDASKDVLLKTIKYNPFLIKPNVYELEETLGQPLKTEEQIVTAAKYLQSLGAQNVLVSRGDKGAVLIDEVGNVHKSKALNIKAINTVGAGDSMVAGFLAGFEREHSITEALRWGIAAGSATATSPKLATKEEIVEFLK